MAKNFLKIFSLYGLGGLLGIISVSLLMHVYQDLKALIDGAIQGYTTPVILMISGFFAGLLAMNASMNFIKKS